MASQKITIQQGKTFQMVFRVETPSIVYKPITAITKTAPVKITAVGHGLKNGWRAAVVSVKGMSQINAKKDPPADTDYLPVTVVDVDNIEFNTVNASDFATYTSGGYIQYNAPKDLTGYTARMAIKDRISAPNLLVCTTSGTTGTTIPRAAGVDGTAVWGTAPTGSVRSLTWTPETVVTAGDVIDTHELLRLDTTNSRITVDPVGHVITLSISAADTAALSWSQGVYDLEIVSAGGEVTELVAGSVTVTREVTT